MRTIGFVLLAAAAAVTPVRRTPTPGAAAVSLSPAQRAQGQKVLSAAITTRQAAKWKPGAGKGGKQGAFQAHRCALSYDERISGKERAANGPFRTSCSDWVSRATRELAQKDADQPCTTVQYGPSLAACTTWIEQFDASHSKWSEVWRKASP